jgi:hypothetical protein
MTDSTEKKRSEETEFDMTFIGNFPDTIVLVRSLYDQLEDW